MTIRRPTRWASAVATSLVAALVLGACSGAGSQPAPSAAASLAASQIAVPAGFPLGAWTTTITAEDLDAVTDDALASIGMSRPNLVKENAGTFTTTFAADGTWSTVQETDQPVKWPVFRGTFQAVGDDAMDQVTTFPGDFAGDVVRFTWKMQDGKLHLTVPDPPDPVLPVITEAHPWSPAA